MGRDPSQHSVTHCPDSPNCRRREVGGGDAELEEARLPVHQVSNGPGAPYSCYIQPPDYLVSPSFSSFRASVFRCRRPRREETEWGVSASPILLPPWRRRCACRLQRAAPPPGPKLRPQEFGECAGGGRGGRAACVPAPARALQVPAGGAGRAARRLAEGGGRWGAGVLLAHTRGSGRCRGNGSRREREAF